LNGNHFKSEDIHLSKKTRERLMKMRKANKKQRNRDKERILEKIYLKGRRK